MAVEIVLAPGTANEKIIPESEIDGQLNPAKTHTGLGDFAATIKPDTSVDAYAQRQDRININVDGNTVFTGYLHTSDRTEREATQSISGPGIAKKLEETRPDYQSLGGPVTYTSIALQDAIDDYWNKTPFGNHTVYNQTTTEIVTNRQIQSADTEAEWQDIANISGNQPIDDSGGELSVLQTCWTTEGESEDRSSGVSLYTASRFSGNSGTSGVGAANQFTADGQYAEYDFSLGYSIPDGEVGLALRGDSNNLSATAGVDVLIDGTLLGTWTPGGSIDWEQIISASENPLGGLSSGSHTLRLEGAGTFDSDDEIFIDVVAPYDNRFSYTFDNSVSSDTDGNTLSGPELYPDAVQFELAGASTSFNITEATVNSTWNDTGGNAISVSNNNGQDYLTANNTNSTTKSFSTTGATGRVRFTLSRFGSGAGTTPSTGFNGQEVQDYTLTVDGNDLVVIDKLQLSRDHFSNLQTLHNYGDFVFSIDHGSESISNIPVYSFRRGEQTQTSPSEFSDPIDEQSGIKAGRYYNVIYVQGARNSGGDGPNGRPVAEAKADSSVINNDGREITGFVRDQSITTEDGAAFRARALLEAAQSNSDLIGTKTITPVNLLPGFSYSVDFGQGAAEKVLETVDLSYGESIESTAKFAFEEQIASEIKNLKAESRNLGNQV